MMDLLLYTSIRDYIYARISFFTEVVLSRNLSLALTMVLALLTLWVMIQGYLLVTGRSQEGVKGFIFNLGKNYIVITIALGVSIGSNFSVRTLTDTLSNGVSQIMHGNNDFGSECLTEQTAFVTGCKIDLNLKTTQLVLSSLSAIDTADDDHLEDKLSQAKWFAGIGTAGPAIVAGTMLIMYRIAIALFVGFAPIFILCLLFKRTAPLFQKWLYFGLATIFSSVMLGIMSEISMDLIGNVFGGSVAGNFVAKIIGESGPTGIMETVTQQLGLGLMLSTLLITVPPMAGMWFNGVMGSFSPYSVIGNGNRQEVPPHLDGGASRQMTEHRANQVTERLAQNHGSTQPVTANQQWVNTTGSTTTGTDPNQIKTPLQTQYGLAGGGPKPPLPTPQPKPDPKQQPDDSI